MRVLAAIVLCALPAWASAQTFIGFTGIPLISDEVSTPQVEVPNVISQATAAAADDVLELAGLDAGGVTARCSLETNGEVIGQSPGPGVLVDVGSLVDLLTSNGQECVLAGAPGVRLKGLRMRGL